jgi:hypothetical protein
MTFCLVTGVVTAAAQAPSGGDRGKAKATAQRIHDELNKMEVAATVEGQDKYFSDQLVRMDAGRPIMRGKAAFSALQKTLRSDGFKVQAAKTTVIDAWEEGGRLYEYGTTDMAIRINQGGITDDPTNYFAIWRVNPAGGTPQLEFIIWNAAKPVEQLKVLSEAPGK